MAPYRLVSYIAFVLFLNPQKVHLTACIPSYDLAVFTVYMHLYIQHMCMYINNTVYFSVCYTPPKTDVFICHAQTL